MMDHLEIQTDSTSYLTRTSRCDNYLTLLGIDQRIFITWYEKLIMTCSTRTC